ncbi:MAG: phage holin family protein [Acidobacteriota bacterium]|nr:phage holin family protein [Acidobacteriota bacterium]MDQ7087873.1 phage holin family protein [Acidobacteriota bacterium]
MNAHSRKSLYESFSTLLARVAEGLQLRLELLGVELQEEKQRLAATLLLAVGAAGVGVSAWLTVHLLVVLVFWEQRVIACAAMLGADLLLAAGLALALRRRLKGAAPPFSASVAELRRDRQRLDRRANDA